jgi:hypothetical protein
MTLQTVTVDDVIALNPCGFHGQDDGKNYTRVRIERLFAGRPELTALDILDLDIPAEDRLWAVLRTDFFPEREIHELACVFAERAVAILERHDPDEKRPRAAIEAKRRWLHGEITDRELDVARAAAWAASRDVARAAAWAASRDTAWAAAWASRDAAWAAAWDAMAAARDAAWDAAWDGELEWQVARTREAIRRAGVRR